MKTLYSDSTDEIGAANERARRAMRGNNDWSFQGGSQFTLSAERFPGSCWGIAAAKAAQQPKEPLFGFDYDDAFEAVPLSKQLAYMDHLEHAGFGNPALKAWLPVAKVGEKFGDCRRVA